MRSVYLACPAFLGPGGISSYARRIVEVLAPERCDVLDLRTSPRVFPPVNGADIVGAPASQVAFAGRLGIDYLRRPSTWFLFAHVGLTSPLGLVPRRRDHRVSMILHGIEAWTPLGRRRGLGLRSVDSLVFTTEYSKAMFMSFNHAALRPDAETVVIPLSAEGALEAHPPAPVRTDARMRVLCVTRLTRDEPLKGVSTLLQAAAHLPPRDWEIVFLGDGDGRTAYEAEAARLGVNDRVRFLGWVADDVRTRMLEDADVFCLPSAQEGFGIAFLEAMVAGRPCVGAAAGAVPEVVQREAGELFPFGDAAALATVLQRVGARVRSGELTPASIRAHYDRTYSWRLFQERWKAYSARMRS